jgi:hypothetical protein
VFNPTAALAQAFGDHLAGLYEEAFGRREAQLGDMIREGSKLIFELLSGSDALYHNAEHTAFVTLVGQDILRGRRLKCHAGGLASLHACDAGHDIGYVRGVCRGDSDNAYLINDKGRAVTLPRGASDASLTPYHVERSKIVVLERFTQHPIIDAERVARAIELTRFPVPEGEMHQETDTEAGLVRAADLIGQLSDPFYPRKINALFHEFEEIGVNAKLGYKDPADIAEHYPRFFWTNVEPYVRDAMKYLSLTVNGRQWTANLYTHVFEIEHGLRRMGPQAGADSASLASSNKSEANSE